MSRMRAFGILLLVSAAACARSSSSSSPPGSSSASRPASPAASRSSDVITASELASPSVGSDALEAVRRLRPRFLASRGASSMQISSAGSVHVSVDGGPLVGVDVLGRMRPSEIAEIRYLSAAEAAQQFGTTAGSGPVLLVKSK